MTRPVIAAILGWLMGISACAAAATTTTAPATRPAGDAAGADATSAFDPTAHLLGDPFGGRSSLANRGVTIDPTLILDDSKVLRGGLDTRHDAPRGLFSLAVTADTDKLAGLHGGTIYALMQSRFGINASARRVGDIQNFSVNTDVGSDIEVSQLYYRQALGPGDGVVLKAGKIDANADFDVLENGQEFINNSWGGNPTIGLLPSYPNTATGVDLFVLPGPVLYAGAGLFDGSFARGVNVGPYGPSKFLDRGDNLFLIAEAGGRFNLPLGWLDPKLADAKLAGHVGLGGWYSTDPFKALGGGSTRGTGGAYVVVDQVLWHPSSGPPAPAESPGPTGAPPAEEDPRSVAIDFSYAQSESDVNLIDRSVIAGVTWIGPVPRRERDSAGLGVLVAGLSPRAGRRTDGETSLEAFYRVRLTQWVSVKPDVQYIFHPNGNGATGSPLVRDALVVDLRVEVAF